MTEQQDPVTVRGCIKHVVCSADPEGLAAFKKRVVEERTHPDKGPQTQVLGMAWASLEVAAEAEADTEAANAISVFLGYLRTYGMIVGQRMLRTDKLFPFVAESKDTLTRALELAEKVPMPPEVERRPTDLPNILISYSPTPETPAGHTRILVARADTGQVVIDQTFDPVAGADFVKRVIEDDGELLGRDIPRVPVPGAGAGVPKGTN